MEGLVWGSQIAVCVLLSVLLQFAAFAAGAYSVTDRSRLIAAISAVVFAMVGAALAVASIRPRRATARQRTVAGTTSVFLGGTATLVCWLIAITPKPN